MLRRYLESEKHFEKTSKIIPLASQTFSKSITQYPLGASPLFIKSGKGSIIKDLDDNRYVDLVASLGAITLGYCDNGQQKAIKKQLKKGSIFSLPSKLEFEVAELLCDIIPSAEMVRFAKNGTDVTSGAIRLARAFTGKNHIIASGYHGWQDWFIAGTSRNLGIPKVIQSLIHNSEFGNIEEVYSIWEKLNGDVAAIILEPLNNMIPKREFLLKLREFCTKNNIVLIFDEIVTGFRVATAGAQELFQVNPDLSCYGKGIANGFPLAALVGKKEIMLMMEKVFLSGTFGGDTISLASAKYIIQRYIDDDISKKLNSKGNKIRNKIMENLNKEAKEIFDFTGNDAWLFHKWTIPDSIDIDVIKTFFLQENLKKGLLVLGTHNVMNALNEDQINFASQIISETVNYIAQNLDSDFITEKLECEPIRPLFKIRK
jgi:glutamate-1-semialdehyde 2,1-aminomutase